MSDIVLNVFLVVATIWMLILAGILCVVLFDMLRDWFR